MNRLARVLGIVAFITLVTAAGSRPARAQGWDYGRNMFGFAQYYPGSGWSSYYHPNFDPDAWFPTTFGLRAYDHQSAVYVGPRTVVAPRGIFDRGRSWAHGRRRVWRPATPGYSYRR